MKHFLLKVVPMNLNVRRQCSWSSFFEIHRERSTGCTNFSFSCSHCNIPPLRLYVFKYACTYSCFVPVCIKNGWIYIHRQKHSLVAGMLEENFENKVFAHRWYVYIGMCIGIYDFITWWKSVHLFDWLIDLMDIDNFNVGLRLICKFIFSDYNK